jgi:hypothetical protein
MLFDNCPFFFIMSEVGAKTYTEVVYLVSLLLFPESEAKQCLYCCFLFNFTSSNMSKNLSQYHITMVTCMISYSSRRTVGVWRITDSNR